MTYNQRPPQRPRYGNTPIQQAVQPIVDNIYAKDLDLAAEAHKVIKALPRDHNNKIKLTTTQLRKFLSSINLLSNKVMVYRAQNPSMSDLSSELSAEVRYLKIKLAYQSGREAQVKEFSTKANLEKAINDIGNSLSKYDKFSKYIEALVAYHKFEGGQ